MIKSKTVTETRDVEVVEKVFCDKCGKQMSYDPYPDQISGTIMHASFGYGSNKDCFEDIICICDECYDKWLESFCNQPERKDYF